MREGGEMQIIIIILLLSILSIQLYFYVFLPRHQRHGQKIKEAREIEQAKQRRLEEFVNQIKVGINIYPASKWSKEAKKLKELIEVKESVTFSLGYYDEHTKYIAVVHSFWVCRYLYADPEIKPQEQIIEDESLEKLLLKILLIAYEREPYHELERRGLSLAD
jgi:hypothetical protein